MVDVTLNEEQSLDFAQKAIDVRFPEMDIVANLGDSLIPTRPEDEGIELWKIYNVVQEKLIYGNFTYTSNNKIRKARPIKNFQQDIIINEQLWQLAESYI